MFVFSLNTMPELYQSLKKSLITEKEELDEVSLRTANLLIEDFEHSGVHLKENQVFIKVFYLKTYLNYFQRKEFVYLSNSIFESGSHYVNGVDTSIKISETEAQEYDFNFNELTGPWGASSDYRLRKFTFGKYFEHNNIQVIFFKF